MNQASDRDTDAPEAWNIATGGADALGNQIVVAIVDGGCQLTHTDLAANIWQNTLEVNGTNGVDDDGNGYVDDKNGWDAYSNDGTIPSDDHGTHVSGTVGAIGNNSSMVAGINWSVKLMEVAASSGSTSIISIGYGYVLHQKTLWWASGGKQARKGRDARVGGVLLARFREEDHPGYRTFCRGRCVVNGDTYSPCEGPTSLNTLELLPQLQAMGVAAIKIEGRQRSPVYVETVTKVWLSLIHI